MTVRLREVRFAYDEGPGGAGMPVVDGLSLTLTGGRLHCLHGPSGVGKTTLLRLIGGLLRPVSGEVSGVEGTRVSVVFQDDRLLPWASVAENIAFVLHHRPAALAREDIARALGVVELADVASHRPDRLSGGMRRRVAIARALAYGGDWLLLDEPFQGLDRALARRIMDHLVEANRADGRSVVCVTHDPAQAAYLADEIHEFAGPPLRLVRSAMITDARGARRTAYEKASRVGPDTAD